MQELPETVKDKLAKALKEFDFNAPAGKELVNFWDDEIHWDRIAEKVIELIEEGVWGDK